MRDLHVELDEVSQLLDASKEQYEEVLSIVRRHMDQTLEWLSNMAAEFSWVSWAPPSTNRSAPQNIFRVTMVTLLLFNSILFYTALYHNICPPEGATVFDPLPWTDRLERPLTR